MKELIAALEAFLRAPSTGSNGHGSISIEVTMFNLVAARAAIVRAEQIEGVTQPEIDALIVKYCNGSNFAMLRKCIDEALTIDRNRR